MSSKATASVWADAGGQRSRASEVLAGLILGGVSALTLTGTHRMSVEVGQVDVPWGLVFGALFQVIGCIVLVLWSGRKLPLAVFAACFAMLALLFAGTSAGGGVLMPAEIAGQLQWQGWAVQLLGVLIPLAAAALVWIIQIRHLHAVSAGEGTEAHVPR